MPNKNIPLWATLLVIIAVIGGVFAVMKVKERPQAVQDFSNDEMPTTTTDVTLVDFLHPEDWAFKERAEKDIQSLGKGQYVQFGVVEDPVEEEIVYFATAAFDDETEENKLSIYRYNERTYDFERVYRGSYGQGDSSYLHEKAWPVWNVIGYDKNGLIVLLEDGDNSPGPCAEPLLVGTDNDKVAALLRLDLSDPSSGLAEWTAPQDLIDDAEERQTACQESMQ